MEKDKLKLLQKKGQVNIDSKISYLVGALIVIVMATALAPTMFGNASNISGCEGVTNCTSSVPSWIPTVLLVIIGAGIVFLIWRSFNQ